MKSGKAAFNSTSLSGLSLEDRNRFLALAYIKSHTILGLEPFDYLENHERRKFWKLLAGGGGAKGHALPLDMLDSRGVRFATVHVFVRG